MLKTAETVGIVFQDRVVYGFQQCYIPFFLSAVSAASVFCSARALQDDEESHIAGIQHGFLRFWRSQIRRTASVFDWNQLFFRSAGFRGSSKAYQEK